MNYTKRTDVLGEHELVSWLADVSWLEPFGTRDMCSFCLGEHEFHTDETRRGCFTPFAQTRLGCALGQLLIAGFSKGLDRRTCPLSYGERAGRLVYDVGTVSKITVPQRVGGSSGRYSNFTRSSMSEWSSHGGVDANGPRGGCIGEAHEEGPRAPPFVRHLYRTLVGTILFPFGSRTEPEVRWDDRVSGPVRLEA